MRKRLCLAAALSLTLVDAARAQYAYTFTSGPPPIGDGTLYPRSLNPARQTSGGAGPDTFFGAASMGFVNTNGNPAFFDANNLFTRPSRLINGAAFWTDPRLGNFKYAQGSFSIASMGLNVSALDGQDFGFDLAIASVSGEVQPYVPFQIQDSAEHVAVGYLYFAEAAEAGGDVFQATQVGTFQTLNSPHPSYEGRFTIRQSQLQQMIRDQYDGAAGDADLWFFDMRLESFATGGGTTQVAMDNVVYGGATPRAPTFEPTYLPPTQPVGTNTPQYFAYAEAAPEDYAGDAHQIEIPDVADAKVAVSTATFAATDDTSAGAAARGASVYFKVPPDLEVVGHEVSHVVQEANKNRPTVAEDQTPLGGDAAGVNTVLVATPSPGGLRRLAAAASGAAATTSSPQVIEVITALSAHPTDPALRAAVAIAAAQGDTLDRAIFSHDEAEAMSRLALVKDLALSFDDVRPGATPDGLAESPGTLDPAASFYFNYSVLDYLTLKDADGEPLYLGDGGSVVAPTFDPTGHVAGYSITTWLVTNQSGVFVPIFVAVPEPTSLAALLVGAPGLGRRRRCAR